MHYNDDEEHTLYDANQPIANTDDMIDTRTLLERIELLRTAWAVSTGDAPSNYVLLSGDDWIVGLGNDEGEEIAALLALVDEIRDVSDVSVEDGTVLVRDAYFEDYAREMAESIGLVPDDAPWPLSYIDWERAAAALLMDYSAVDFDGVDYWVRA